MFFKLNRKCPCGSGKRYKYCCANVDASPPSATAVEEQACTLVDQGNVMLSQNRYEEALGLYNQALAIYPDYARAHYNSGVANNLLGQLEDAAVNYRNTIKIDPNDAEAHSNLGVILRKQGHLEEAFSCYRKALELKPNDALTRNNLGVLLKEVGRIEEAAASYEKAISIRPQYVESYNNLGVIFLLQGEIDKAVNCFEKALEFNEGFPQARIYSAIIAWIQGDVELCGIHLGKISPDQDSINKDDVAFVVPYHQFLTKLVDYRRANPDLYGQDNNLPRLYLLGDSHSLSSANLKVKYADDEYIAETGIVIGCKAWHLANSSVNEYKYGFDKIVGAIPDGSIIIVMFGEIDCRINEGIISHYKKRGGDLAESIGKLVHDYTGYVLERAEKRNLIPIFCNVPARITDYSPSYSSEDIALHRKIVALFNQSLEERVRSLEVLMLDVYSITKEDSEKRHGRYHLDDNHLKPDVLPGLLAKIC